MQAQEQRTAPALQVLHPACCFWALIHPLPGLHAEEFHRMGRDGWQALGAGVGDCYCVVYQQMPPSRW